MGKVVYEEVVEGEWVTPKHRGYRHQCCGCGLVHDMDFRVVDGGVQYRVRVNARATAAVKRAKRSRK